MKAIIFFSSANRPDSYANKHVGPSLRAHLFTIQSAKSMKKRKILVDCLVSAKANDGSLGEDALLSSCRSP